MHGPVLFLQRCGVCLLVRLADRKHVTPRGVQQLPQLRPVPLHHATHLLLVLVLPHRKHVLGVVRVVGVCGTSPAAG